MVFEEIVGELTEELKNIKLKRSNKSYFDDKNAESNC